MIERQPFDQGERHDDRSRQRRPVPGSALALVAQARAVLGRGSRRVGMPGERFRLAHLAALRAAAAVLAERGRPACARRRLMSVWVLLDAVAPELTDWARYFAAGAPVRAAVEAGARHAVERRVADDQVRSAEEFIRTRRAVARHARAAAGQLTPCSTLPGAGPRRHADGVGPRGYADDVSSRVSNELSGQHERHAALPVQVDDLLIAALGSEPRTARVLDCGGGTGRFAVPLAAAGATVTVLDVSVDALATLRRRAERGRGGAARACRAGRCRDRSPRCLGRSASTWCSPTGCSTRSTICPERLPASLPPSDPAACSACWSTTPSRACSPGPSPATSPAPSVKSTRSTPAAGSAPSQC